MRFEPSSSPVPFDDGPDSEEAMRNREAIVEMANLTNGMTGGLFAVPQDRARANRSTRVPALAVWSLALPLLPSLIALVALTVHVPEPIDIWVSLVFEAIPAVWIAALVVGVITLARRRNGRWRWAGVAAIVLAIGQFVAVVLIVLTFLGSHPI